MIFTFCEMPCKKINNIEGMMSDIIDFDMLKKKIKEFGDQRDWEKHHNPKNIVMALSVETAELVEIFQWLTPQQAEANQFDADQMEATKQELADILLYLVCLADKMGINISDAVTKKMALNAIKYPIPKEPIT